MKYLDINYYVEVKDHRYRVHQTENIILRKRDPPTSLRTQYQVQNETQIRKNQKVIKNDVDELVAINYHKNKQLNNKKLKFKPRNCPTCKQNFSLEFDKGYYCQNCENIINKQKHPIDKKYLDKIIIFFTRLNYVNEKIREIWMSMVNNNYNSIKDMINKVQELKRKTNFKNYKKVSD